MALRMPLILKALVLIGFIGFSGTLLTSQWLSADEKDTGTVVAAVETEKLENTLSSKGDGGSTFSSGSALAIILVVIALVAVARREVHDDSGS